MNYHQEFAASRSADLNHRGIGLSNTIHSEVAPCLPLPSLPVFCGGSAPELWLFDELGRSSSTWSLNRAEIVAQSARIADLLQQTDVSYLNLRGDSCEVSCGYAEPLDLHDEVLRFNPEAFNVNVPGPIEEQISYETVPEKKTLEPSPPVTSHTQRDYDARHNHHFNHVAAPDKSAASSRRTRAKKKTAESDDVAASVGQDPSELQDAAIQSFCELVESIFSRAEIEDDDRDEAEWIPLPLSDLRILVNELMSIRAKKLLPLLPVDLIVRLLRVLDNQIHRAEGLSINGCNNSDSDMISSIFCGLESIHAALVLMAHDEMPKQIYKEEIIERVLEFTKHQIMDVMCAYDPSYRALHRPSDNGVHEEEEEEYDAELGSATKKRRLSKTVKVKKSAVNKVSSSVHGILQKMCTILGLLKDLLLIQKLSDSCILQLVKTSFTTFLVDNIQLLQLKAISLLCGIFYFYTEHRSYVMDELLQILFKLPSSKRALRNYYLPDEEQKQIQMVTALLIQLVICSSNLPNALRQASASNPLLEDSVEVDYPVKCIETVNEACCLFWSGVLQRFATVKSDASEVKLMMENLVTDLLTTLNLPEYPSSAPILQVLCVLLLQNAGPKCKDIAARTMAIEILGTIAARLKREAAFCSRDKFWILQDLDKEEATEGQSGSKDLCSVCLDGRVESLCLICEGCQRMFHADCINMRDDEVPNRGWNCEICVCRKHLLVLQSYCKSQFKEDGPKNKKGNKAEVSFPIREVEIVQQLLLNYLQDDSSADDVHIFVRWFYLCLWYKDDPKSHQKLMYYIARLKSKAIVWSSSTVSPVLTRASVKKITLALGQINSFARGFDKILRTILVTLQENSSALRTKALRAVSIVVEADPEVLGDKRVQLAVEGRFCDSGIAVREAALELVGRHIASHPDVGLKYFEKVAERIKDTGVSVRKRAIKIIRDMYTSNENFAESTRACIEIISRVGDEESSIQDLVCKTLYEFWFEEPSGSQMKYFGDGSSVPLEIAKKTEQIVEMCRRMPSHQHLVTVIRRNLALDFFPQAAKAAGINPLLLAAVRKRCELMCKCLMERVLQVEEMSSHEVEMRALPYILVLHSFCTVDPSLCSPASDPSQFVVTLLPYLKTQADNKVVARLLESIIYVIDSVLPLLRKLPQSVVEELEQDLRNMILRHSFLNVVHACIKCLCAVSKLAGKGSSVVEYLINVFFKFLEVQAVDNKQQVGRSLFCLGSLIRYGNSLLSNSSAIDVLRGIDLFKKYLHMDDFAVKVRSLQALGYLLIARPEYMLEKDIGKLLEVTLASASDDRIKMQALQNIFEYLLDSEGQLEGDQASNKEMQDTVEGGEAVPVAAGAGDTNICGGIIQLYWDHILGRCLDSNDQVRQTTLKIVEVVLRQGLVHPITCVPYLIALEADPVEANSKLSHHLLMNMNEKYPAFFESRLGDGLQMSFIFVQCISSSSEEVNVKSQSDTKLKSDVISLTQARLGVSRIYKLIRGNRVSRNKFMSSIVRKFDTPVWTASVVPFLMYCTEVLALLPFTTPDEPLYLVYAINRVIQVRAGVLEAKLKALSVHLSQRAASRQNGISRDGVTDHEMASTDDKLALDLNGTMKLEAGDQGDMHSAVSEDSSCISKDDEQMIQGDCLSAVALQLLLKLKRHLKIVYSLNDARCQAFSPTEPLKAGDALSRQNIPLNIGENRMHLPTTSQELVQVYQEFKVALREDTVDYSTYTANIKRKRPTPRKGRKPVVYMGGGGDDEDDDDEDYSGGRRLSNSARRSVNTRSRIRF